MTKHPGFKAEAASIERKEGVSKESADAILAAGAHKASAKARAANPNLNRVSGTPEQHAHVQKSLAKHEAHRKTMRRKQG